MKKSRYTEEQIIRILKESEAEPRTATSAANGDMQVSEARRLKSLEEENRRLKSLVADLTLDNSVLKDLLGKNF